MSRSNDEIYELLHTLDKKVDTHIAVATLRLDTLEEKFRTQLSQRWQIKLALLTASLGIPMSAVALLVK